MPAAGCSATAKRPPSSRRRMSRSNRSMAKPAGAVTTATRRSFSVKALPPLTAACRAGIRLGALRHVFIFITLEFGPFDHRKGGGQGAVLRLGQGLVGHGAVVAVVPRQEADAGDLVEVLP